MSRPLPIALALTSLAALPLLTGCGNSKGDNASAAKPAAPTTATTQAAAPANGPIDVSLTEWKVAPSATSAKAGKVTFDVTNDGKITHEFVVIRTNKPDGKLGTGARVPETGNVGETGDVKVGAKKRVTLDLKPGRYQLVCNISGHYMSGMHTEFAVQ